MNAMNVIAGAMFLAADIFAVLSLAIPEWIRSSVGGETRIGLLKTCLTIYGREMKCFTPENLRFEWMITFMCICVGIVCVTITIILLITSKWKPAVMKYARWLGFVAIIAFCQAAVIFPIGFNMDQIGGEAYQLPYSYHVGTSYILFVVALWMTVISELFAGKVCLPNL